KRLNFANLLRLSIFKGIILCVCLNVFSCNVYTQESDSLRINLDVKNMSIIDVMRLLAEQGKVNIVASRNVQGRVSAKLQDVSVKQALGAILDANNFTYKEEDGIIKVFTRQDIIQKEQTAVLVSKIFQLKNIKAAEIRQILNSLKSPRGKVEIDAVSNQAVLTDSHKKVDEISEVIYTFDCPIKTQIYNLNYADASEINAKLVNLIPKQEGEVFVDKRTNSIVVRATEATIDKANQLINNWDKHCEQVLIEAKILEVSLDNTKGLGINWEYQSSAKSNAINVSSVLPASIVTGGIFKIGTLTEDEYAVTIQALETSTNTNVLSSPRISVMDNTEANILVGSAEPYVSIYLDKETNTQTEETKFINVGVKLKVTPQISGDGYVRLKIHPEVSSARRVSEVNNALAIDTTQADTTVLVKDGKTIVLAGLIKDTYSDIVAKVPVLGDVPILGIFFRNMVKTKIKKEIIVFITPHILNDKRIEDDLDRRSQAVKDALQAAAMQWDKYREQ
ncbi:MAG: hypothetical protein DRP78_06695, partial [Candidatus Omnitrophota bacterium]